MQPRSPLESPSDNADYHLNGWSGIDIDWELPLEPSLLATFGLDTELHQDNGILTSIPSPVRFEYGNHDHNRDSVVHTASHDELLTPALSSGVSSINTTFALSFPGTTTYAGYDGSPISILPVSSHHTASAVSTMLPSSGEETEEEDEQLTNLAFWAGKIMQLNVQLMQHLQTIPRVNLESLHHDNDGNAIRPPRGTHNSDLTFHLSETLIDILSSMCSKLPPPQASAKTSKDRSTTFLVLDEASCLLVFSTYLRFLEMHNTVFRYLLACLSHKRENTAARSCFYLPKLTIGSFSLASTSETRPLLFVNIMESMLARAKNLVSRLASVKGTPVPRDSHTCFDSLPPIIEPDLALQAVHAREAAILSLVDRIKTKLSRPEYVKD